MLASIESASPILAILRSPNEGGGYCQLAHLEPGFDVAELMEHESLRRSIMAKLAAKCVMQRVGVYDDAEWRTRSDYVHALEFALELNGGDQQGAELMLAWLERKTDILITELWPQINELTYALLNKGRLSGREVIEILERTRAESVKAEQPVAA